MVYPHPGMDGWDMWRAAIAALAVLAGTSVAAAATISSAPLPNSDIFVIGVDGPMLPGDYEQFRRVAVLHPKAVVRFNSDGGNLLAGIEIGKLIRLRNFGTLVVSNQRCASACALAWLGGTVRFMGATALIGFHAGYDATSGQETGVANAVIGVYLNEIGLSYNAAIYITRAAPDAITWLNVADARRLGIDVSVLNGAPALGASQPSAPPPSAVAAAPLQLQPNEAAAGLTQRLRVRSQEFLVELYSITSHAQDSCPTADCAVASSSAASRILNTVYDDSVNYYGKELPRGKVVAQIAAFLTRWPIRSYAIVPGTLAVTCNASSLTCAASGLVDFDARSPLRNEHSFGQARFSYSLRFASEDQPLPKIVLENGSVVERHKGKLIAAGIAR
jgi:hypothetical protein